MERESWYVNPRIATGLSSEIVIWSLILVISSCSMVGVRN